jgi:hypothetical protein
MNGTHVNRAQLRPHRDTQIKAGDMIALGGTSGIAFRLIALHAAGFLTALQRANACLASCTPLAEAAQVEDADDLVKLHHELLSAAGSTADGRVWLKVGLSRGKQREIHDLPLVAMPVM